MWKNFMAMPIILKLLTAGALGMLLIVVSTVVPGNAIHVFGRDVTHSEWWSTGAGLFTLMVGLVAVAAAALMLKRSIYGRPAYIFASAALSLSGLFVAGATGVSTTTVIPSTIGNLVLTLAIALYLYLSKGAKEYFLSASK